MKTIQDIVERGIRVVLATSLFFTAGALANPRPPLAPVPDSNSAQILWQETFNALYSPTNRADLIATQYGTLVSGGSGYALQRTGSIVSPFVVPALSSIGHTNICCGAGGGAIRLWAMPHWTSGSGPGADGWLAGLGARENGGSILTIWWLQVSGDGSTISLMTPSDSAPITLLSAPIAWEAESAHCLVLNFGPQGSALFIDGQLAVTGAGTLAVPPPFAQLVFGSSFAGDATPTCALDEICSFCGSLEDASSYYMATAYQMALGPLTPEAISARLRALVRHRLESRTSLAVAQSQSTISLSVFTPPGTNYPPIIRPPFPPTSTNGLTWVAPDQIPARGNFWRIQRKTPPLPCNWLTNCNVFALDTNGWLFLVDDTSYVYPEPSPPPDPQGPEPLTNSYPAEAFHLETTGISNGVLTVILHGLTNDPGQTQFTLLSTESLAGPEVNWLVEQDIITAPNQNSVVAEVPLFGRRSLFLKAHSGPDDGPRVLFAEITGVTADAVNLQIYSTGAGQIYDILTRESVTGGEWVSTGGTFLGLTNWTPATVPKATGATCFLRARCWRDGGWGIPTWWMQRFFGSNPAAWPDPYAICPSGDGWTILQAYQNGWDPNNEWHTPPPPQCLAAKVEISGTQVDVSWCASGGSVTGYTLERDDPDAGPVQIPLGNQTSFVESIAATNLGRSYRLLAQYGSHGPSPWSGSVKVYPNDPSPSAVVVRGPEGRSYLAMSAIPNDVVRVHVTASGDGTPAVTNFDVSIFNFTNGLLPLPEFLDPWNYSPGAAVVGWQVQTVNAKGIPNGQVYAGYVSMIPFFDGRRHLADNLAFLVRDYRYMPFRFRIPSGTGFSEFDAPSDYGYTSFCGQREGSLAAADRIYDHAPSEFRPFAENFFLRNLLFTTADLNAAGWLATGASSNAYVSPTFTGPLLYVFSDPTNLVWTPPASLLPQGQVPWTLNGDLYIFYDNGRWVMPPGASNIFGLAVTSARIAYNDGSGLQLTTIYPGESVPDQPGYAYFYEACDPPSFLTTDYYFARLNPHVDPLPGDSNFSPTNATPLMIVSVGQKITVAGYAKQIVLNGDRTVPAYLGQYFDKAYMADATGTATTNQTGVLSEYGEFLATDPGLNILKTKPDLTQTNTLQGQCPIYVIKLGLDVNHDGTMDLSFGGPDNTAWLPALSPYMFWLNNDYDRGHNVDCMPIVGGNCDWEEDDLSSSDRDATCPLTPRTSTPDSEYRDQNGDRVIPCERDLEDFARLWVCGLSSNLLTALPIGTTVTLSWGDIGSPNPANPTIDLFQAADADGGVGYLTNATIAMAQTNASMCQYVGRLGPGQSIQLNSTIYFTNGWAGDHLIWCGVHAGTGLLTLTIWQGGTNPLAQTSAYIQLQDIKQMYERWTVRDNPTIAPTNRPFLAVNDLPVGVPAFQYGATADTNTTYIVHVHGFNMETWEKDRYAETEFKRLYWQGYQGRFGEFRWPTTIAHSVRAFDNAEFQAWKSGAGLLNLLSNLNRQYPGNVYLTAHSHGNIVAGEALRLAGANQVVNTYIAMQGAVASHAYDPTTPIRVLNSTGVNTDSGTPNRYAQYFTAGAPCYFNGVAGAARYINFYNTNDWALTLLWRPDQDLKPDLGYHWDGVNFSTGGIPPYLLLLFPLDTYEIFSYCDEARCEALGAQANVGGPFLTPFQVDLAGPPYNFGRPHKFHSGEFRSDCARRWFFWDTALRRMQLK